MPEPLTADNFMRRLEALASDEEREKYRRYFTFGPGTGDEFIGVRMGQVFALAKEFVGMGLDEVEKLLESPIHEVRVGGVSVMDFQARDRKTTAERRKALFDLYMRRHDRIDSWDLVDRSAINVVGGYLADKPRAVLYELAGSERMAERRTAIVATAYFMMNRGELDDTFAIAELLVGDEDQLVQKAVGWMLRVAGDIDRARLLSFLDDHAAGMPAAMLSAAIEKLDKLQKAHYRGMRKRG
jgi:3-methyladenine DNA glycosylase AlkD